MEIENKFNFWRFVMISCNRLHSILLNSHHKDMMKIVREESVQLSYSECIASLLSR